MKDCLGFTKDRGAHRYTKTIGGFTVARVKSALGWEVAVLQPSGRVDILACNVLESYAISLCRKAVEKIERALETA